MKSRTLTTADHHPTAAILFISLAALAAVSGTADARSCGMMNPPAYMGMPMYPMSHPAHKDPHQGRWFGPGMAAAPSVIAVAKRAGNFSTLLTAIEAAGLTGLLGGEGPFTLLAPTDDAFKALPEGAIQELLGDKERLTAVLKYHVVPGYVSAADILSSKTLETASGQSLPTSELSVVRADIRARNGAIHVVDKVLLPSG